MSKDRPDESTRFAMVPERLNPGGDHAIADIPLVVGADDPAARDAAETLFSSITETVPVASTETAELSKTVENTYRMVNIALVNQLVALAERLDADVWEAIDAAGTKPFGFQAFEPGPGVGGHCIPIDPQFLLWRANELGTELPFIEHAHEVNEGMPERVVEGVTTALKARGVAVDEASVLAFGAAYKPNVGDPRHSPAIEVFEGLCRHTNVTLVDPHVDSGEMTVPVTATVSDETIEMSDAVVLLVDHDVFDLDRLGEHASFVYDAKNAMPSDTSATVVTLGENVESEPVVIGGNARE
ncbi:nucleotide sugar dehydrogenase [Halonotius sp. GCM10025705]|uniref:nucleotide sugar dehydrogenase n=1 Tax=Halonotius sp. GCM10025705 TaxID=3252678 RepID=UPI0036190A83